jgi:hypothetical protein
MLVHLHRSSLATCLLLHGHLHGGQVVSQMRGGRNENNDREYPTAVLVWMTQKSGWVISCDSLLKVQPEADLYVINNAAELLLSDVQGWQMMKGLRHPSQMYCHHCFQHYWLLRRVQKQNKFFKIHMNEPMGWCQHHSRWLLQAKDRHEQLYNMIRQAEQK